MRIRVVTIGLAAAATLFSLTACGSSGSDSPQAAPTKAAGTPSAAAGAATGGTGSAKPTASGSVVVPSPNAAQQAGLLAGLKAVNPELAADPAKAVGSAQYVCAQIHTGKDDAAVAKEAAARFSGGSVTLTDQQGKLVIAAVRTSFCTMP
ncbi:DUF732 domain-containing protein [Kitasatospora sp. NPDC088346]|uniref:DUF732 domain-containing protein n=1 Tax=Kitasatospora sp. NPDC088346 TaxID=3364073 RepID=UPI00382CB19C